MALLVRRAHLAVGREMCGPLLGLGQNEQRRIKPWLEVGEKVHGMTSSAPPEPLSSHEPSFVAAAPGLLERRALRRPLTPGSAHSLTSCQI